MRSHKTACGMRAFIALAVLASVQAARASSAAILATALWLARAIGNSIRVAPPRVCPPRLPAVPHAAPSKYNTDAKRVEGKINVHIIPHSHDDVGACFLPPAPLARGAPCIPPPPDRPSRAPRRAGWLKVSKRERARALCATLYAALHVATQIFPPFLLRARRHCRRWTSVRAAEAAAAAAQPPLRIRLRLYPLKPRRPLTDTDAPPDYYGANNTIQHRYVHQSGEQPPTAAPLLSHAPARTTSSFFFATTARAAT